MSSLAELLVANHAHSGVEDDLNTFGQFVGRWAMDVAFLDEDGTTVFAGPGEWCFGWILDGRAIQDVLHYDTPDRFPAPPGERRIGTTLRFLDPTTGLWRIAWCGAAAGIFLDLAGGAQPDGSLLVTGRDVNGDNLRWQFTDITRDSFQWTGWISADGDSWRVEQSMAARRV